MTASLFITFLRLASALSPEVRLSGPVPALFMHLLSLKGVTEALTTTSDRA
jgi:hypothetical protein